MNVNNNFFLTFRPVNYQYSNFVELEQNKNCFQYGCASLNLAFITANCL